MGNDCCSQTPIETDDGEEAGKAANRTTESNPLCPQCSQTGMKVPGQTIKALLSVSLRRIDFTEYYFCRTQSCPVVYFSENGSNLFLTSDLRERVLQKEPNADDVLACYCFRHTAGEIRGGSPVSREAILNNIRTGIRSNQCACDMRNPQGSCCLGNVLALMKQP